MRKVIKTTFYWLCRLCCVPLLLRLTIQRRRATVILFHEMDRNQFKLIISYLEKKYNIITPEKLAEAIESKSLESLPKRSLVITFDDGRRTNLDIENNKYKAHIINFLSSDKTRLDGEKFVSEHELMSLSKQFKIGGHTHTHPDLSQLDFSGNCKEIQVNKDYLTDLLGQDIHFFAYPFGQYHEDSVNAVNECGYRAAFTVDEGFVDINDGPFKIKRICISNKPTVAEVAIKSSGLLVLLKNIFKS